MRLPLECQAKWQSRFSSPPKSEVKKQKQDPEKPSIEVGPFYIPQLCTLLNIDY